MRYQKAECEGEPDGLHNGAWVASWPTFGWGPESQHLTLCGEWEWVVYWLHSESPLPGRASLAELG